MAALMREPEFAGPQNLLDEAEVETPQGWRPISEARHEAVGPDTQIRVKLSDFSQELTRRMDEAGLYTEPQPHPSRRAAPPPPPRKRREAQRKRKRR